MLKSDSVRAGLSGGAILKSDPDQSHSCRADGDAYRQERDLQHRFVPADETGLDLDQSAQKLTKATALTCGALIRGVVGIIRAKSNTAEVHR